jgi:hypothetical protein
MTTTTIQEREEIEFGFGPRLWDADPDVCCAAFQLGACVHTEVFDPEFDLVDDEIILDDTRKAGDSLRRYGDKLSKAQTLSHYVDQTYGIAGQPAISIDREGF